MDHLQKRVAELALRFLALPGDDALGYNAALDDVERLAGELLREVETRRMRVSMGKSGAWKLFTR